MSNKPQSFASHAKFDPPFHFFVLPVFVINVITVVYQLFRHPGIWGAWLLLLSLAFMVLAGRVRSWATHLQDRVIRMEERFRLTASTNSQTPSLLACALPPMPNCPAWSTAHSMRNSAAPTSRKPSPIGVRIIRACEPPRLALHAPAVIIRR